MPSAKELMIAYVVNELVRRPEMELSETTPLVSSGLIDSLALVDILQKLEELTNTRLPTGKIQAKDMDTVERMFATAERLGRARR